MFRRYNRWQSRFDQPDPYDGSHNPTDPQSFNRYAYVQNDPVSLVDPSGLEMSAFCGAEYSFSECGGGGGFWGGNFGGDVAEYNREYGGLPRNVAEAMRLHDQRVANAEGGYGFLTTQEVLNRFGGGATDGHATLCLNGLCWDAGSAVWSVGNSFNFSGNNGSSGFNVPLAGAGMIAGAGEFSNAAFGHWRGLNNQWIPESKVNFYGNGATGSKYEALGRARGFRLFGRAAFVVGAANTWYQYHQGHISGTKAAFDIGFGAVGTLGGPYGFAANTIYTGVDMTVGWPAVGQTAINRKVITGMPIFVFR